MGSSHRAPSLRWPDEDFLVAVARAHIPTEVVPEPSKVRSWIELGVRGARFAAAQAMETVSATCRAAAQTVASVAADVCSAAPVAVGFRGRRGHRAPGASPVPGRNRNRSQSPGAANLRDSSGAAAGFANGGPNSKPAPAVSSAEHSVCTRATVAANGTAPYRSGCPETSPIPRNRHHRTLGDADPDCPVCSRPNTYGHSRRHPHSHAIQASNPIGGRSTGADPAVNPSGRLRNGAPRSPNPRGRRCAAAVSMKRVSKAWTAVPKSLGSYFAWSYGVWAAGVSFRPGKACRSRGVRESRFRQGCRGVAVGEVRGREVRRLGRGRKFGWDPVRHVGSGSEFRRRWVRRFGRGRGFGWCPVCSWWR